MVAYISSAEHDSHRVVRRIEGPELVVSNAVQVQRTGRVLPRTIDVHSFRIPLRRRQRLPNAPLVKRYYCLFEILDVEHSLFLSRRGGRSAARLRLLFDHFHLLRVEHIGHVNPFQRRQFLKVALSLK